MHVCWESAPDSGESEDQRDLRFCNDWRLLSADPDEREKVERENFFAGLTATVVWFLLFGIDSGYLGQGFHLWEFCCGTFLNSTNFSRMDGKVLFDGTWYVHSTNPLAMVLSAETGSP